MHICRHELQCTHSLPTLRIRESGRGAFGLGTTSTTRRGTSVPDSRRLPPRLILRPRRQLGILKYCKAEHPGRAQRVGARAESSRTQFKASLSMGPWVEPTQTFPSQPYQNKRRETQPTRKRYQHFLNLPFKQILGEGGPHEGPPGALLRPR